MWVHSFDKEWGHRSQCIIFNQLSFLCPASLRQLNAYVPKFLPSLHRQTHVYHRTLAFLNVNRLSGWSVSCSPPIYPDRRTLVTRPPLLLSEYHMYLRQISSINPGAWVTVEQNNTCSSILQPILQTCTHSRSLPRSLSWA
jgi:hypothetical protein